MSAALAIHVKCDTEGCPETSVEPGAIDLNPNRPGMIGIACKTPDGWKLEVPSVLTATQNGAKFICSVCLAKQTPKLVLP